MRTPAVSTLLVLLITSTRGSAQTVEHAVVAPPLARASGQVAAHEIAKLDAALSSFAELSESSPAGGVATIIVGGIGLASGAYLALDGSQSEDERTHPMPPIPIRNADAMPRVASLAGRACDEAQPCTVGQQ
jgi:hypothetical protein